jgi:uncharacterized MAPEG superfamily protein
MTTEILMLTLSVGLLLLLVLIQATAGVLAQGLMPMANNRDNLPAPKPFQARTLRVVDNHREGLTMFAPLILVAALLQLSNQWTVLGAQLFFYGRLAHAVIYLAGWPLIRPLAWALSIVGTLIVLLAVLGILA